MADQVETKTTVSVTKGTSGGRTTSEYSQIMNKKVCSMLEACIALREEGKPDMAITKLTRALTLQPENPELFQERAKCYFLTGDFHATIINLKRLLLLREEEKEDIALKLGETYYHYGVQLASKNEHEDALEKFDDAFLHDPNNREIITRRLESLVALERYTECRDIIEMEVGREKANADLFIIRAQLNLLFGQFTKGYWDICKALELQEEHAEAMDMKKDLQMKAIEHRNRAVHQTLAGKTKDAVYQISMAIATNPVVADYHILRGMLYRNARNFTAAVDDYLKAMDKCGYQQDSTVYSDASRQLVLTYNDFAVHCFRKQKFNYAITLLNKAIKEEKREMGLYLNRGDCFYRTHMLRFSLCDYKQALELDPTQWGIYCRVAIVCSEIGIELFAKGQHEEAESYFTASIHHNPKVARFYLCRARARHQLDNIKGSKEDIVSLLTLDPSSEECLSLIARVFPGKSKRDILLLHPVTNEIKCCMETLKEKMSVHKEKPHPSVAEPHPSVAEPLLSILECKLKIAADVEEDGSADEEAKKKECKKENEKVTSVSEKEEESKHPTRKVEFLSSKSPKVCDPPKAKVAGKEEEAKKTTLLPFLLPQDMLIPPPAYEPPTELQQTVMPALRHCIEEAHFHRSIYYSKKFSTEHLRKLLGTSLGLSTLPQRASTSSIGRGK